MNHRIIIIIAALSTIMLSCMTGCKSSHKAVTQPTGSEFTATGNAPLDISEMSGKQMVENLIDSYKPWQDVSMSVKCKIRSPKNITVSGKATMIRGKEIQISLRMLGFEVAGIYINCDSIYVYEKLNKTMIVEPMSRLKALSGITISDIQDLLLGRICYPGVDADSKHLLKKFEIDERDNNIILTPRSSAIEWSYALMPGNPAKLLNANVSLGTHGNAECRYAPALMSDIGPVSPYANLVATAGKHKLDATFNWSLETASWNSGATIRSRIPKGYRRIPVKQLVKLLIGQ